MHTSWAAPEPTVWVVMSHISALLGAEAEALPVALYL
jgi:hypothetical protein